ncbi:hypothetical protein [Corynebacterium heidelbergense]|uniref:Uncharacterized protein n=1 Tax=Corynebacterium heidelbergense TaxID=2055947 RepID=A0A364V7Q1_9CORY|nr:hypothetical protein [Corynebacterium heidelbergense]RAV32596.1 hypothetical protein DLJ54_02505 [Corynebacterium heidelbergense]
MILGTNEKNYRPSEGDLLTLSTERGLILAGLAAPKANLGGSPLIHIYNGVVADPEDTSCDHLVESNTLLMAPVYVFRNELGVGGSLAPVPNKKSRPKVRRFDKYYYYKFSSRYLKDLPGFVASGPPDTPLGHVLRQPAHYEEIMVSEDASPMGARQWDPDTDDTPQWYSCWSVLGDASFDNAIIEAMYGGNQERFDRAERAHQEFLAAQGKT